MVEPTARRPLLEWAAGLLACGVLAVGGVELYGWLTHTRGLIQLRTGQAPMPFNTALCLALLALALLLLLSRRPRAAVVPAAFVGVFGTTTLAEYVAHRSFGIDRLLFHPWIVTGVDAPGRMARNTALSFALLGVALLVLAVLGRRDPRGHLVVGLAASFVAALAMVALFGYAGGVATAYTWRTSTAMAPLTAAALLGACVAAVAAVWAHAAGHGAPRWLPVPVGVCALAGTLFLWQSLLSLGATEDRTVSIDRAAGLVLAIGLLFSALVASATAAGQQARQRRRVAEDLSARLEARARRDALQRAAYDAVSRESTLDAALAAYDAVIAGAVPHDRITLALVEADRFVVAAAIGGPPPGAGGPIQGSPFADAVVTGEPVVLPDTLATMGADYVAQTGMRSLVVVPVLISGEVRALLGYGSREPGGVDADLLDLVVGLSSGVSGPLYTLARLRDEQRVTARLRELDALKNEFVGVVAHDLRSPMTVVTGYVDTVLSRWDVLPDADKRDLLQVASRNTKRLAVMVEDVLQVARIESGEFPYEIKPFDLRALVLRTCADMTSARPERPVVADVPENLPLGYADEDRQWRVLTNLVSNAQKFTPDGVAVTVAARARDGYVEVTVTDQGPGIAEDDLPRLFAKFSRLSPAPGGEKGTGLGLYITRALVEAQGGEISVDSRIGAGTTMRYTVPTAKAVITGGRADPGTGRHRGRP